ncbi:hypothetical protein [Alicyclobacillus fastidiosus]|uniref:Uncharacterized protein n=1 Tax=Alicyclobacillus fastidiosus TaxID=392011 RepID=A0ABV5AKE1_9BACL|nr:hypothetical protein [Alicyclobacillus fastidiosus]WEH09315.1 hypothetical protein PYS47_22005 [Alicyclobacillus fastidiosus]
MVKNVVSLIGPIPSLETVWFGQEGKKQDLVVKSWAPYQRFAVQVADDGLDSFGLKQGNYAVFREARWPDRECQVCLVRFGDEVTIRLVEGINSTMVTLRVSSDRIPPLELEPTDFSVVGILDGVVFAEFAEFAEAKEEVFDWGC